MAKGTAVLLSVDLVARTVVARFFDGPEARDMVGRLQDIEQVSRPNLLHVAIGMEPFPMPPDEKGGRRTVIHAA
jgi:hypothetical protein